MGLLHLNSSSKSSSYEFDLDLSSFKFQFNNKSNYLVLSGVVHSNPESVCDSKGSNIFIACAVSKVSLSSSDFGASFEYKRFTCSGYTLDSNMNFQYPNYFSCVVSDKYYAVLAFAQRKTDYEYFDGSAGGSTDGSTDGHKKKKSVSFPYMNIVFAVIIVIACCACSFCYRKYKRRKNKINSEVELAQQQQNNNNNNNNNGGGGQVIVNAIPVQQQNNGVPIQGITYYPQQQTQPQSYYPNPYDPQNPQPIYYIQQPIGIDQQQQQPIGVYPQIIGIDQQQQQPIGVYPQPIGVTQPPISATSLNSNNNNTNDGNNHSDQGTKVYLPSSQPTPVQPVYYGGDINQPPIL